jgi:hypothetical protein
MAGANNAMMKTNGIKASQIATVRATHAGPVTMASAIRASKDRPGPPKGWQQAAQGLGGAWRDSVRASRAAFERKTGAPSLAQAVAKRTAAPAGKGKLKLTPGKYTWKRGADGNYAASDGRARLEKTGKTWHVVMRDGTRKKLGNKASFDHAEQAMARHGAR